MTGALWRFSSAAFGFNLSSAEATNFRTRSTRSPRRGRERLIPLVKRIGFILSIFSRPQGNLIQCPPLPLFLCYHIEKRWNAELNGASTRRQARMVRKPYPRNAGRDPSRLLVQDGVVEVEFFKSGSGQKGLPGHLGNAGRLLRSVDVRLEDSAL